jgi:predicted ester cyclase
MSSDETRALFKRFEEALNARRLDELDAIIAPDFTRHCQATPDLDIRSLEQFKDFLRADAAAFPDNVQTFHQVVVEGDRVGYLATYEGTQTGPLGPFPPSGKRASFDFAGIARMENGKIAEWWITWDNLTILGQLGHLPAPAAEAAAGV